MFRLNLPAETGERIAAERGEVLRLYGLTDEWLAHALLKLARKAQAATPGYGPENPTYSSDLVWGIIPELSRRLGTVRLVTREIDWEVRELSDYELRRTIGYTLPHISCKALPGWNLLTRTPANGNPVVIAIDRLCPGTLGDGSDNLTCRIEEAARSRKTRYVGRWSPEVLTSEYCTR